MPISRRKILSQSRDELDYDRFNQYGEKDDDVWYSQEKLLKDHIAEILAKWDLIDDDIWGKLIYMERNWRVAKAYARAPVLTINGADDGFDGYRIGLNGFDNPMRDAKTEEVLRHIGQGVKLKMDDEGNIHVKRLSKCHVFVKGWQNIDQVEPIGGGGRHQPQYRHSRLGGSSLDYTSAPVGNEIIKCDGQLELDKAVILFDMKKFKSNVSRELRSAYPDRRKLEAQCVSIVAFVKDSYDLLDIPCWVMVVNIVAMDMLKSKLPPLITKRQSVPNFISIFEGRSGRGIAEEDPYSLPGHAGSGSSSGGSKGSSGHYATPDQPDFSGPDSSESLNTTTGHGHHNYGEEIPARMRSGRGRTMDPKPPKLPPRDFHGFNNPKIAKKSSKKPPSNSKSAAEKNFDVPTPDYDEENIYDILPVARKPPMSMPFNSNKSPFTNDKNINNSFLDEDPYYCGFRARVPNYAKQNQQRSSSSPPHTSTPLNPNSSSPSSSTDHPSDVNTTTSGKKDGQSSSAKENSSSLATSQAQPSSKSHKLKSGTAKFRSSIARLTGVNRKSRVSPPPPLILAPAPGPSTTGSESESSRKVHFTGYLNTLFRTGGSQQPLNKLRPRSVATYSSHLLGPGGNTNSGHMRSASYHSFYDSSLESDPYAAGSSGDGTDIYGIYGRIGGSTHNISSSRGHTLGGHGGAGSIPWPYIDRRQLYAEEWDNL